MSSSRTKCVLVGVALVLASLLATSGQATLIGVLEQNSPTPTIYVQGTAAMDPAPAEIQFTPFGDVPEFARGEATGNLQYVPGLADDPQDFIDAGFVAGSIAMIDRGVTSFSSKIRLADDAGAVGALIVNTSPSANGWGLFEGGADGASNIPALMITYELGQQFITAMDGGATINLDLGVRDATANPAVPLAPGMWNTRIIAIDDQNGAADHDIDNTMEALAILEFANGGPNVNGWNIRYDVADNRNLIDMAGGAGNFLSDHPYPNGQVEPDNSPGVGEDFLVTAETALPVIIPEGDWTIGFGSDDGGALRMPGVVFTSEMNTNGDPGLDDTIVFNDPRGHSWTAGEFTVGPGGLTTTIEAIMFERSGGDSFEIAISQGHSGYLVINDVDMWHTLQDGTLGWRQVPEPSTSVLGLIGLIGLLAVGLRRRKAA